MKSDATQTDRTSLTRLAALIETARDEAARLGTEAANVAPLLEAALTQARNIAGHGGHPDEGLRPDQLNTENDK